MSAIEPGKNPVAIGGLHPRLHEGRAAMPEQFGLHRFDGKPPLSAGLAPIVSRISR